MRRFEYRDDRSQKFWEIEREGTAVTTRWGRIGAAGQSKTEEHRSVDEAQRSVDKQIASKSGKGYAEAGSTPPPTPPPTTTTPPTTTDLADGDSVEVPGSGGRTYVLRQSGGAWSCTCPAWRNQSVPVERRTCKHLRRYRGEEAEAERLGSLPERAVSRSSATEGAPALLLAHAWDPDVHDPTGWWMSEKLDGVRAFWDGRRFVSRLGNEFLAPDWFTEGLPDHPLDGELFVGRGRFQETVGIVRRADRSLHWEQVRYLVFDGPELPGGFEDRLLRLRERHDARPWRFAAVLEHARCQGPDALVAELRRIEGLGGEGLMLRQPGSAYVVGRSETLLKVKTFSDAEAKVVGHVPGAGRHAGRLGALEVVLPNGVAFKVGTGFSDAEREDPPPLGAIITFKYQELTRDGVPRFPTYVGVRHDLAWPEP